MKCENCKENEAELCVPKNGSFENPGFNLCKKCAYEKGYKIYSSDLDMSVQDLFGGLMNLNSSTDKQDNLECSNCGLTFENFKEIGRLGCSHCYTNFHKQLELVLRKLHATTKHRGKQPLHLRKQKDNQEYGKLKKELKCAIKNEQYEKAAEIRDKIKSVTRG